MISELNDEQILDLLMTSEFEADLSPTEFKFLLRKWRYFYRLLHGRFERVSDDLRFDIKCKEDEILDIKQQNYKILVDCADKENTIDLLKNRKLTFKERWTGKIIEEKDEDKTM
jgi:hypothetical protein